MLTHGDADEVPTVLSLCHTLPYSMILLECRIINLHGDGGDSGVSPVTDTRFRLP